MVSMVTNNGNKYFCKGIMWEFNTPILNHNKSYFFIINYIIIIFISGDVFYMIVFHIELKRK